MGHPRDVVGGNQAWISRSVDMTGLVYTLFRLRLEGS